MNTTFTFRDIEATEGLKTHTLRGLAKLEKYLIKPISIHVIMGMDGFRHKVEVTLVENGKRYVGTSNSNDMYLSIDAALDKLEIQLKKYKERTKGHHKTPHSLLKAQIER